MKVAHESVMPSPPTTMDTPVSPTLSTTSPARGGPDMAATPRLKVKIPKAEARDSTPIRLIRVGGVAETQNPENFIKEG